jgi:hypothetical protein
LQDDCPINKVRGNLFAIPLKKLKAKIKIKIQDATDNLKSIQGSSSTLAPPIYTTVSSSQSRDTVPLSPRIV